MTRPSMADSTSITGSRGLPLRRYSSKSITPVSSSPTWVKSLHGVMPPTRTSPMLKQMPTLASSMRQSESRVNWRWRVGSYQSSAAPPTSRRIDCTSLVRIIGVDEEIVASNMIEHPCVEFPLFNKRLGPGTETEMSEETYRRLSAWQANFEILCNYRPYFNRLISCQFVHSKLP